MKKIFLLSSALFVFTAYSAEAQISVTFGTPGYYYPHTVYSEDYVEYYNSYPSHHYVGRGHRQDDHRYWAEQRKQHDNHEEGRHDNGNHNGRR